MGLKQIRVVFASDTLRLRLYYAAAVTRADLGDIGRIDLQAAGLNDRQHVLVTKLTCHFGRK